VDQLNRDLLCDWLELEGYEVWSSANLRDNFDVFARRIPDAVLLDIHLGAKTASASSLGCTKNRTRGGFP
jgi:CheY-like chemotaxis protein